VSQSVIILLGTAATVGFVHTILGPDHYLPFIAMSKARRWSLARTLWITSLCGVGHVAGSIVLGLIGIAAGITLKHLEFVESARGEIAAWLLMAFGLAYGAWGIVSILRNKPHKHVHVHADGTRHEHTHAHTIEHAHPHGETRRSVTPWVLFTIFVLGPCEPLIPLLMFPAAAESSGVVALVAIVFSVVTIATMIAVVMLSSYGINFIRVERLGRYGHALAGAVVFICGVAIQLGL
jgi:sulfite exporter TauE/SafE